MKKFLFAAAALALMGALSGCVSTPGYPNGAWAGYDAGFDDGYHGYDHVVNWDAYDPAAYGPGYGPPPYGYPVSPGYPTGNYGPQGGDWYAPYDCPPPLRGH